MVPVFKKVGEKSITKNDCPVSLLVFFIWLVKSLKT